MAEDPVIPYASLQSATGSGRLPRTRITATVVAVGTLYWSLTTPSHLILSSRGPAVTNTADAVRHMVRDTPAENWDLGAYTVTSFAGFHSVNSAYYGHRFVQVPEWAVGLVVGTALSFTFWYTRRSAAA